MQYNPLGHRVRKGCPCFCAPGQKQSRVMIILALLCILIILIMMDAKEYARCDCIYPDEVMDLRFSVHSDAELLKNPELHNESTSFFYAEEYQSSSLIHIPIWGYGCIKNSYILTAKGRLFSFHRYNS